MLTINQRLSRTDHEEYHVENNTIDWISTREAVPAKSARIFFRGGDKKRVFQTRAVKGAIIDPLTNRRQDTRGYWAYA